MSDPQHCEGGPQALARVKLWMTPCTCTHPMVEHDIIDQGKRKGQRSGCLRTDGTAKCGCTLYRPAEEAV